MDIRGVEITNQLRSAIRAKLIELGVRYDEELPDYILVMVVNKKSRQQMNEDLNLFLEDNTDTFVDWLHDQVLKKLQKVTVAKKKKITPSAAVKQEDEKKIKTEDESKSPSDKPELTAKQERDQEFEELVGDLALLNEEDSKASFNEFGYNEEKLTAETNLSEVIDDGSIDGYLEKKDTSDKNPKIYNFSDTEKMEDSPKLSINKAADKVDHPSDSSKKKATNILEEISSKKTQNLKRPKISYDSGSDSDKKLKSSVSKPKLTSVVTVKSRLGKTSSKKPEALGRVSTDVRTLLKKSHDESRKKETLSERSSFSPNKSAVKRKHHSDDLKIDSCRRDKSSSKKLKSEKPSKLGDLRDEINQIKKSSTVKSRLGISNIHVENNISPKSSSSLKETKPKLSNVKSRLGIRVPSRESSVELPDYIDEDDADSILNTSLKSHIIAIKKTKVDNLKTKNKLLTKKKKKLIKAEEKDSSENSEEEIAQSKFPSKVIVTPRPLKPLQPFQRRATQSLLLKAVAEANKSVVMQKKVDPCLKEKDAKKKIKIVRDPKKGKVVSINLNSKKKTKAEKIKIELKNSKKNTIKPRPPKAVRSEHLNLVKSLFKKSDDKQKFLVTLSGYNNNIFEENDSEEEEEEVLEDIEMNVNEDNDFMDDSYNEIYVEEDQITDDIGNINEEDNDVVEIEYKKQKKPKRKSNKEQIKSNVESSPKKKKKINPIVYTKSVSDGPENKPTVVSAVTSVPRIERRPPISSVITTVADKSSELCRYWPSCTLGFNCAYHHPEVPCSSFPACKFGEKCAYKHPNCKFGSSCAKVGCIFSHPPVQCKYHPYCMKPGCPFSHPKTSTAALINAPLTPDLSSVRAKFTWKKKD